MKKFNAGKLTAFFVSIGIIASFSGCADYVGENTNEAFTDNTRKQISESTVEVSYTVTSEKITENTKADTVKSTEESTVSELFSLSDIPKYDIEPYAVVNDNIPYFTESEKSSAKSFEIYSELDKLSRCTLAYACIGTDIMPTEERGKIGNVKPTGWHTVKYDNVDGGYLYNRCHLIGYQLSGENANEKNLITGTRYMNTQGMLPFENMVADFVKETDFHVLYRVTPVFDGENLLASGVLMEAYSIEDEGDGICFNVFCYNVQPGISINYKDGSSELISETETTASTKTAATEAAITETAVTEAIHSEKIETETYILNINTKKFHKPSCSSAKKMKDENKEEYTGSRDELIADGYSPCKKCKP